MIRPDKPVREDSGLLRESRLCVTDSSEDYSRRTGRIPLVVSRPQAVSNHRGEPTSVVSAQASTTSGQALSNHGRAERDIENGPALSGDCYRRTGAAQDSPSVRVA